jgi:hypothetical protein
VFSRWFVSGLIDSVFLAFWAFVQYTTNGVIGNIQLFGIDQVVFIIFQWLFAISTLAPIAIYVYVDIRVMLIRAKKRIGREEKLGKTHGNDSGRN